MKKWTRGLLAMITAASLLQIPAFAAEAGSVKTVETQQAEAMSAQTGDAAIRLTLHLEKAESTASIEQKAMRVTLEDSSGRVLVDTPLVPGETAFSAGDQSCTAVLAPLNEFGVPITTESDIHYYRADFLNLPVGKTFRVGLSAKGFTDYVSDELALTDYSKHLVVDTASRGFTMGDVNGDKQVTKADLSLVEKELGGTDEAADLNLDGTVDITDIALVNHHIAAAGEPEIFDTTLIAQSAAAVDLPDYIHVQEGKAEDILSQNGSPVTFAADGGNRVEIPIVFHKSIEMDQISIVSPDVNGALYEGALRVEDEDGNSEEYSFSKETPDGVHALAREAGTSTVVIKLNKRVAVKKVTVIVTRVQGEEGQATYAVVDHIEFLKDIVPDDPADNSVPKGVTAQELDGEVRLSWKAVHNVTGYVVRYGTASGQYTLEAATDTTEISITGLKNLTPYYFVVVAANGDWRGTPSSEVSATPQPKSVPMAPDNVKLTPGDGMLGVSWSKTKNARTYSVYYKESAQAEYTRAAEKLEDLRYGLGGLTNGVEYDVYVTAANDMGESKPSLVSTAAPEKQELEAPKIPTLHRIPSSDIIDVQMENKDNVDTAQYPNGFDVRNVIDGDYATHWTARKWWESRTFIFTFTEEKTMDYLIYVPRLDGNYRKSLDGYSITVWDEAGNKTEVVKDHAKKVQNNPASTGYAVLTFPKTEHIKKIAVDVNQWAGSPTNISLSEIAFYDYNSMDDAVNALFTDGSFTRLNSGVTSAQIETLRAQASDAEGYFVDREILLDELALAQGLLEGRSDVLGRVTDGVQSRNTQNDLKVVNTFQPLGVVANANTDVVIYAEIPDGENVQVVPTQYFAEAGSWKGTPVQLSSGRNIIKIPKLMTISGAEYGGALYLQYSGGRPNDIKLQVRGAATQIPVLELSSWDSMSDSARRATIDAYITELTAHVKKAGKNKTQIRNATEISLPNVLLSLPADQVLSGIGSGGVQKFYDNALAWDELLTLLYRTHGVDDLKAEHSRQNIRYMRMFADAFMYASGDHVGVGYASASALVQGRPVSVTGAGKTNGLFGWGIAHEVGHVLDTLGKAETTNNIYSLYAQTYDGGDNALTSRLEGGKYADIFQKTAVGGKGVSNDVFVSLGMYWQLHLAYDGKDGNFYNELNKQYRGRLGGDAAFMEAASAIAGEDLSDFFARWGMGGSRSEQQGTNGTRLINYLNDDSRRARLRGDKPATGTVSIKAGVNGRDVELQLSGTVDGKLQGYEISRDGQSIAFVVPEEGTGVTFTDHIGSANNRTLTYSVKAVDVLGYVYAQDTADEVRIQTDNVISRNLYQVDEQDDGTVLVRFDPEQSVAGFIVRGADSAVDAEESATLGASGEENMVTLGASGNLMTMEVTIGSSSSQRVKTIDLDTEPLGGVQDILRYFTVSGEEDGRIGIYDDVQSILIRGWDKSVALDRLDFISYSGDDISITENAVGHLAQDFDTGRGILKAGTLVVTGPYVGDPVYNTIHIEGKFSTGQAEEGKQSLTTRAINGDIYLFAQVPGEGDMSEVSDGLWIFVPDVQREQELAQGQTCGYSVLPAQIRAILYRRDDPDNSDSVREVSNTRWISVSTEETMPEIVLEGETSDVE